MRFRNQKSERELQIQFQIFFFIKEIGGGMASKYFLEERWNNIEGKGGGDPIGNQEYLCPLTVLNKGNNQITELRTILQRESQNS